MPAGYAHPMSSRVLALVALLALPFPVAAQQVPPGSPATTPAPGSTATPSTPASLSGVTATLTAPRNVTGSVPLTLTLKSSLAEPITFGVGRDNDQNCAFAPTVRVLRVGTREVVYPAPGAEPRICTQELLTKTAPAGGSAVFTRDLNLPAGDYIIEGWFGGFAHDERVKVPAQPVRVTVR
ncbi:hypothetical protein DAERI_010473 [Deinococcus aerius]|uniref:Uncharacterized protein n=2 Tax=Deinococcus aerius TaxID=200253 RepID=A0A2I9DHX9_9DEIO|nr:hypothetical protein DAERI_010473 [Deinococcus aerius]